MKKKTKWNETEAFVYSILKNLGIISKGLIRRWFWERVLKHSKLNQRNNAYAVI